MADLKPDIPLSQQVDYILVDKGWGLTLAGVSPDSVKGTEMGVVQVGRPPAPPTGLTEVKVPQKRKILRSWLIPCFLLFPGWLLVRRLAPGATSTEQVGLAALLGMGGASTLLFLVSMLGVPLSAAIVIGILLVATLGLVGLDQLARRPTSPVKSHRVHSAVTPAETLLGLALAGLMLLSAAKASLYPISAMDAHSYDGRARWIAAEGRLDLSIYSHMPVSGQSNMTYPPLLPISRAFAYWTGGGQGKVTDTLYFVGILFVLIGFLRRYLPRIGALLGGLLFAATPNIWNHAWMGLTNLPAMAYLGSGIFLALSEQWLGAGLLFGFAAGVRGDAALLAGLAAVTIAWQPESRSPWRTRLARMAIMIAPALLLTVLWQIYLRTHLGISNEEPFRRSIRPDLPAVVGGLKGLVFLLGPPLYGWVGYVFLTSLVLSGFQVHRRHQHTSDGKFSKPWTQLSIFMVLAAGLVGLFQQLDPEFGGGYTEILNTSYKRQLMYLVPIIISAALAMPASRKFIALVDSRQRA